MENQNSNINIMESKATIIYNLTPEDLIEKISEIIKN